MKKSKVITFIGGFYIFGGIIALLSLIFNGSQLNTVFNLPDVPDYIVKLMLGIIYIPIGYLYIKRVNFSSWIILGLAVLTFCISADLTVKLNTQPYIGNLLYSLFVIINPLNIINRIGKNLFTKITIISLLLHFKFLLNVYSFFCLLLANRQGLWNICR